MKNNKLSNFLYQIDQGELSPTTSQFYEELSEATFLVPKTVNFIVGTNHFLK